MLFVPLFEVSDPNPKKSWDPEKLFKKPTLKTKLICILKITHVPVLLICFFDAGKKYFIFIFLYPSLAHREKLIV